MTIVLHMAPKISERFEDGLGYLIHQLLFFFKQGINRKFSQAGVSITSEEMIMLVVLKQNGALKPTELASILAKDKAVITRTFDRLHADGLIHREQDKEDRRAVKLVLTHKGEQTYQRFFPIVGEFICQVLHDVSQKDYDITMRTLSKLIANCKLQDNF